MIDPTNYRALLMARVHTIKDEQFLLKKKLEQIQLLINDIGAIPTIHTIKTFIENIKTIL